LHLELRSCIVEVDDSIKRVTEQLNKAPGEQTKGIVVATGLGGCGSGRGEGGKGGGGDKERGNALSTGACGPWDYG
jgi:hypothetical protein